MYHKNLVFIPSTYIILFKLNSSFLVYMGLRYQNTEQFCANVLIPNSNIISSTRELGFS